MEGQTYVVTGTLTDPKTVTLDESLPISATRVRVTIETIKEQKKRPLEEVLAEIHQELEAAGHIPPTPEEVAEYLQQERGSWEK